MVDGPQPSPARLAAPAPAAEATEVSLLDLAVMLLRHRRSIVVPPLVLFVLVVGFTLLRPRQYTAGAVFIPQSSASSLSRLAGFAAQLGVNVPGGEPGQSPDFYADFLRSDQLLRALVVNSYTVADRDAPRQGTLVDFYDVSGRTPEIAREKAIEELREHFEVSTNVKSGVVSFSVDAEYPELALQVAEKALDRVNTLNLEVRQSRASAEREFIEARLKQLNAELRSAEDRLQGFLQANRDFRNSPQLTFTHDRLQRDVQMQQEVYTTLAQGYEQARIDEVRNTPVISVVERPILPARPDRRGTTIKGLLALILGGLIGVGLALARESIRTNERTDPAGTSQLTELLRAAKTDLRHPLRAFREAWRASPRA